MVFSGAIVVRILCFFNLFCYDVIEIDFLGIVVANQAV